MATTRIRLFAGDFAAVNGTLSATDLTIGDVTNAYVPAGLIIMFNSNTIPTGWALCNGNNGTPDLRDKFIVSVGTSYNVTATKNNNNATLSNNTMPSHNHNFTLNNTGGHAHNHRAPSHGNGRCESQGFPAGGYQSYQSTDRSRQRSVTQSALSSSGNHTHTFNTASTGQGQAFSVAPAYYRINFIMKL